MRKPIRLLVPFSLLLAGGLLLPSVGSASSTNCTRQYALCVNRAVQFSSPYEELASVECGAAYAGCVLRKVAVY